MADWSYRGDYIIRHGINPAEADEAVADPDRVVLNPDPASKSGRGVRIIGVNAWKANLKDQRRYEGLETS
jgi:hypothetical protein